MPVLNYQKWKADKVESGECRQTIRGMRKRPFRVGDRLYHYSGLRTKNCRRLGESFCTRVGVIRIEKNGIALDGRRLWLSEEVALARADGFATLYDMYEWFQSTHRLPFDGQLVVWEAFESVAEKRVKGGA